MRKFLKKVKVKYKLQTDLDAIRLDNQSFKSQIDLSYGGNTYGLYLTVGVLIYSYK